ncbi:single-stranded DNA-binding protein [Tomitella gaofuii]|uniref:single-stranded DNA-binding protein n=1 Tax=Tomitella gaofuii TaxID=2760083 RepID=UPI0015F9D315|nr:single-stranded DNA-binding protein [Tomitella gaofuii]
MALPLLSGTATCVADPELRFTPSGKPITTVRLAFNNDRFNPETQSWDKLGVFYVRATIFKDQAENVADTLTKGMEVVVTGRMETNEWTDKQTGDKRSMPQLLVDTIGPSLRKATAQVTKVSRDQGAYQPNQPQSDPWGQAPQSDDTPPF